MTTTGSGAKPNGAASSKAYPTALLRCLMSAQRASAKAVGDVRLEAGSEFGKRGADMIVCGLIDGELVVAAA